MLVEPIKSYAIAKNTIVVFEPFVNRLVVVNQVAMSGFVGKGLAQLLDHPATSWVRRDVEVEHPAPMVSENEKHEENLVPYGRHNEEVDRDDLFDVVLEEGLPGGGGWLSSADHVLLDGRLGNIIADLAQLSEDSG